MEFQFRVSAGAALRESFRLKLASGMTRGQGRYVLSTLFALRLQASYDVADDLQKPAAS